MQQCVTLEVCVGHLPCNSAKDFFGGDRRLLGIRCTIDQRENQSLNQSKIKHTTRNLLVLMRRHRSRLPALLFMATAWRNEGMKW